MALSTIAFVDTADQPAAAPYYQMFPNEPLPGGDSLMVSKVVPLKNGSAEQLLEQILKLVKPGGNVLLVSHGNDIGTWWSFGDLKNHVHMETDVLWGIRYDLEGKAKESDTAQILKMTVPAWRKLKPLIQKVQALGLGRVDLRACKLAEDKDLIALFAQRAFFGCNVACAPSIYDAFGLMDLVLSADPKVWAEWIKNHKGVTMKGAPGRRIATAVQYTPNFKVMAIADSKDAVGDWVSDHLPSGGTFSSGQPFFHGLTLLGKMPTFSGEPDFPKFLREAVKGKEPPRTIDVRKMQTVP